MCTCVQTYIWVCYKTLFVHKIYTYNTHTTYTHNTHIYTTHTHTYTHIHTQHTTQHTHTHGCTCLHTTVINDHRVKLDVRVELRHFFTLSKKKTICKFPKNVVNITCKGMKWYHMGSHDVSFMDCSDFTSLVSSGIIKSILGNPAGFLTGDYFKTFHHTRNTL